MKFNEAKQDIESLKKETQSSYDTERENTPLGNSTYRYYDSSMESFENSFTSTLPEKISLNQYVQTYYKEKSGIICVELGGPGIKLFKELVPEYSKKTAGFVLVKKDEGSPSVKGHEVIEADVFNRRKIDDPIPGFQKIEKWVEHNGKVDIIFERMVGPIQNMQQQKLLIPILKRWYRLLSEKGTIFVQLPTHFDFENELLDFLKKNKDIFDYQTSRLAVKEGNPDNIEVAGFFLRLRKLEGAPDSIDELLKDAKLD